MKHIVLSLLLAVSLASCLDIEQRYILRPDGSLTVKNDIAMDQSLLKMIAGMSKGDSTTSLFDAGDGELTEEFIDSLRQVFGGKNIAHYKTLPQVREATMSDTVDLKGIHFRTSVTLNSYKDLYLVAQDTVPGTGSMLPKDSAIFVEHGDTLIFHVERKPDSTQSLTSASSWTSEPTVPEKPVKAKSKSKSKSKKSKKSSTASVEVADSSGLGGLTQMMGDLFHFKIVVESPLLLGADTTWKIDPAEHTATWTIDASNASHLMTEPPNTSVWLRKP